jgi:inorganic pyrophosphatase/exopolyphosphatase
MKTKQVKVILERKNFNSDLELSFRFKENKGWNFEDLMLKVIKRLIKMKELENTFIYNYNSNDYLELLKYLELDDTEKTFDNLLENDYTYFDFSMESLGVYMIDTNTIKILDN